MATTATASSSRSKRSSLMASPSYQQEQQQKQHNMLVDQAEQAFICGNYRKALELSNTHLQESACQPDWNSVDAVQLQTPIILDDDSMQQQQQQQHRQKSVSSSFIRIDWKKEPGDDAERAAAVALQSWYELAVLAVNNNNKNAVSPQKQKQLLHQGQVHLRPFLEYYSKHSMSLELLVVIVRVCQAVDQYSGLAVELASEVIHMRRRLFNMAISSSCLTVVDEHVCELVEIMFTHLLPYCLPAAKIEVERFATCRSSSQAWHPKASTSYSTPFGSTIQPKALRLLLSSITQASLQSPDDDWLVATLSTCREKWISKLHEWENVALEDKQTKHSLLGGTATSATNGQSKLTLYTDFDTKKLQSRIHVYLRDYSRRLLARLREVPIRIRQDPAQRNQVVLTVFSLWISWRYRQRLLRILQSAIKNLIWSPAQEIVDALVPFKKKQNKVVIRR